MKKRLFAALLAGTVAISLMACGGSGSSSSSQPAADDAAAAGTEAAAPAEAGDGEYKIDVICKTLSSEYWTYIQAGAEAYSKDHPEVTTDTSSLPCRPTQSRL